ncbi:MAG: hypothetical protein ABW135_12405 [Thermoleophilaceae bacterium]
MKKRLLGDTIAVITENRAPRRPLIRCTLDSISDERSSDTDDGR